RLADVVGDVANVEIFVAELDHLEQAVHRDVGARAGFDNGADPRRQAADAGHLVADFDPSLFLVGRCKRVCDVLVERFDERAFVQDGDGLLCGARRQRSSHRRCGARRCEREKFAACCRVTECPLRHATSSLELIPWGLNARFFAYWSATLHQVWVCGSEESSPGCTSLVCCCFELVSSPNKLFEAARIT